MDGYTHYEAFKVQGNSFEFRLTMYDCFLVAHGICSLELSEDEIHNYPDKGDGGVTYCKKLSEDIIKNGVKSTVIIHENSCGHYSVTSGQHRICIVGRKGLTIPADVSDNGDLNCRYCLVSERGYYTPKNKIPGLISKILKRLKLPRSRYTPDTVIWKF